MSEYSWIPFKELEEVGNDIHSVFEASEAMDGECIDSIVQAVKMRIGKLKDFAFSASQLK